MMMNLFLLKWVSMMSLWNCREGFFRCRGLPPCCYCCASLASLLLSRLLTRLRCHPVKLFLFHLEAYSLTRDYCCVFLSFCLCVLCASVSVFYVLLPRHCRRRRAWGYGLKRWLWLVMAGYEVLLVLDTEFKLPVAVQEGAGPITSGCWRCVHACNELRPLAGPQE